MKSREWTWASSLSIVVGIWCLAIAAALLSGCFATGALEPTYEYCPMQVRPSLYCEEHFFWVTGHYEYYQGVPRWHDGGYYRRPGHVFPNYGPRSYGPRIRAHLRR